MIEGMNYFLGDGRKPRPRARACKKPVKNQKWGRVGTAQGVERSNNKAKEKG